MLPYELGLIQVLEPWGLQALGFLLQLRIQMGELGFQGFLLKTEEGRAFVVWRLLGVCGELPRATQFCQPWGGRLGKRAR